ncbi:MAG: copper resistance protein CopD, partial [Pseudomonadota bacterium]|nr:copper resistance protein CopD [Pseudomonadota bacterium]
LFKLALVAIAVLLGGYNRFFVMPSLTAALSASALVRFTRIFRLEAAVLLAVLIAATILSIIPPPTAA